MESHLLQMRGLKRFIRLPLTIDAVASFTDAWIETEVKQAEKTMRKGRIFYRCVD